jgi:hypothetical protein
LGDAQDGPMACTMLMLGMLNAVPTDAANRRNIFLTI